MIFILYDKFKLKNVCLFTMNKTTLYGGLILGIAAIMVFSTVAPALQQAFAHDVPEAPGTSKQTTCPPNFIKTSSDVGIHPDHNTNKIVCEITFCPGQQIKCINPIVITIDDREIILKKVPGK